MAKDATKNDAPDILDEIRQVDKMVRRALLIKLLSHLKYISRKIIRYRELIKADLAEMGISEADAKRIIDFVNESADVKLTEEEIKDIKKEAKDFIKEKKKEIESEVEKKSFPHNIFAATLTGSPASPYRVPTTGDYYYNNTDNMLYTTSNSGDLLLKNSDGSELSVKL